MTYAESEHKLKQLQRHREEWANWQTAALERHMPSLTEPSLPRPMCSVLCKTATLVFLVIPPSRSHNPSFRIRILRYGLKVDGLAGCEMKG